MNKTWHLCFQKCWLFIGKTKFLPEFTKANFSPTFKKPYFPRSSSLFFQTLLRYALYYRSIPCFSLSHWSFNVVICFLIKLTFLTVGPSFIRLGLSRVKKWSLVYSRLSLKVLIENIQVLIF